MLADFHIHTKYSYDSLMSPKVVLKRAKQVGLDRIAITDHGTIIGALETKKLTSNSFGVEVIVGEEIGTTIGDIIGLELTETIPSRDKNGNLSDWKWVLEEINRQGGTSVLPHPYREHRGDIYKVAVEIDVIESWNSRSTRRQNDKAFNLALDLRKPWISGSDAHFPAEIGNVMMTIHPSTTYLPAPFTPRHEIRSSKKYIYGSRMIKFMKKRKLLR